MPTSAIYDKQLTTSPMNTLPVAELLLLLTWEGGAAVFPPVPLPHPTASQA